MPGYAVIDFETTGLFPGGQDRVLEVGLVLVDERGLVEREWATIVNPGRDVGPTHIHGITARDVMNAPAFTDVLPQLLADIRGRFLVAHNINFDLRFLAAELRRAGHDLADAWVSGICTMRWSARFLRGSSRKLLDCCASAGVPLTDAHSALADARAAAGLLRHFLQQAPPPPPWMPEVSGMDAFSWPAAPSRPVQLIERGTVAPRRPDAWLDRIVSGMPRSTNPMVESYLDILESALLDRYLSAHEEQALVQTAIELGLTSCELDEIHRDYLRSMAAVALADDVVTASERMELNTVAGLLGLGPEDVEAALTLATARHARAEFRLQQGDQVCLTGAMRRARAEWEQLLDHHGVTVGALTKKTRLLVAADPDSGSGKAKKAREYGVPIIHEEALLGILPVT